VIRGEVEVTALGHFSSGENTTHMDSYLPTSTNLTAGNNSKTKKN
jgi:hypothetical protein